ncbi:MAG: hydroxyacid dehydrogenase [Elusimicrobiota bacterium]
MKPKVFFSMPKKTFDISFSAEVVKAMSEVAELLGCPPPADGYNAEYVKNNIVDAEAVITGWGSLALTDEMLALAKKLKIVFHTAGSVQGLWKSTRTDIRVASNADINGQPVSEFALGMVLIGLKGVFHFNHEIHAKGKLAWKKTGDYAKGYYKTKVGILSLGHIGRRLVKLLKNFEVDILVQSNHITPEQARGMGVTKCTIEELMSQADVVVLCAPNKPKNKGMINKSNLKLMKDNSVFINIARGALVNEDDLVAELKTGRITAMLDVTFPEPPVEGHPFYTLPNCILTPHIAGSFAGECFRFGEAVVGEIKRYVAGEKLRNELSQEEIIFRA